MHARTLARGTNTTRSNDGSRRSPRVTEFSSMFSPRFSLARHCATFTRVAARRRASARVFPTRSTRPSSAVSLILLSFFFFFSFPPSSCELPRRERAVSAHQASGSPLRFFRFPRTRDTIGSPGRLSPCSARHPVEWTIQFLGTVFVCTTYPPPCRPIPT